MTVLEASLDLTEVSNLEGEPQNGGEGATSDLSWTRRYELEVGISVLATMPVTDSDDQLFTIDLAIDGPATRIG